MYIEGLFLTASRPSRTWMLLAEYCSSAFLISSFSRIFFLYDFSVNLMFSKNKQIYEKNYKLSVIPTVPQGPFSAYPTLR